MSALTQQSFQSILLESDVERVRFRYGRSQGRSLARVTDEFKDEVRHLYGKTLEAFGRNPAVPDFIVQFERVRFRGSVIRDGVFVLRRLLDYVPTPAKCGIHPKIIDFMMSLTSGMVLFMGEFASGKTTAASACTVEYVARNGRLCIAAEDPPELPMEGDHGEGRIYQLTVSRTEIESKAHDLMRSQYDVLYYSELRSALMTHSAIQTVIGGRMLFSTGHGASIPQGLTRLVSLSNSLNTGGDTGALATYSSLGESLKLVVFMREFDSGGYGPSGYLIVGQDERASIAKGDFNGLENSISRLGVLLQRNLPLSAAYDLKGAS